MSRDLVHSGGSSSAREVSREDLVTYEGNDDPIARELKEIRDFRRTNRHAYNKNTAMQQRERELMQAQSPAASLDPELLEEWQRSGGITYNFGKAQGFANAILDAVGDRQDFEDTFDDLPVAVQSAFFAELALTPDTRVRPAPDNEVKAF